MSSFFIVLYILSLTLATLSSNFPPPRYNVAWTSPSNSVQDSMPIGNGNLDANVWSLPSQGQILFYLSSPSAWSETGNLLKLGLVTLTLTPNPFRAGTYFNQTLDLSTSTVNILAGGTSLKDYVVSISVWIDANGPYTYISLKSQDPRYTFDLSVSLEIWRNKTVPFYSGWAGWYCESWNIFADKVLPDPNPIFQTDSIVWYYRNDFETTKKFFASVLNRQGLGSIISESWDPLTNRTFGGAISGNGLKKLNPTTLKSSAPNNLFLVSVSSYIDQTDSVNEWLENLKRIWTDRSIDGDKTLHDAWWSSFWSRSYLLIEDDGFDTDQYIVTRQYLVWRYIEAIQARCDFPIKFNGLVFVAQEGVSPDYRDWGGANWWQNLRLPYYNMPHAGDFDMMKSLFEYYLNMLPLALERTKIYFNHTGAFWPETQLLFGTYYPNDYGCGSERNSFPVGIPFTRWNRYNFQGGLDLSLLILDYWTFSQDIHGFTRYLPIIRGVIDFYAQHWKNLDSRGKIIFYPSQSLETWQCIPYPPVADACVTNDLPDIAGLYSVLKKLLSLPSSFTNPKEIMEWSELLNKLPPLPTAKDASGITYLVAGDKLPQSETNSENPELYAVHPYRLFTVGQSEQIDLALEAYKRRIHHCNDGWCQDIMDAALLGLADDAMTQVVQRARTSPASGYRFPAFMPHFQDYEPSADHLSNMNNALQWMLIQPADDERNRIVLFPAWPCQAWNVQFKLIGPLNTVVEGSLRNGNIESLVVTPPERKNDIIFGICSKEQNV